METDDAMIDLEEPLFLAPGFLVSILGAGIVAFPQLTRQTVRRPPLEASCRWSRSSAARSLVPWDR